MSARSGFVWHERLMWHDARSGAAFMPAGGWVEPEVHGESPATKRRLRNLAEVSGLLREMELLEARRATREEILRFHTPDYLDRLQALSAADGGLAGPVTPFGPGGLDIAALSAGACSTGVEAVVQGVVGNAYVLCRPPGHHALPDTGDGFCMLGNVALAALHARAALGLERVAIVDWDAHHGNGTQAAFWEDPSVLTISLHQDRGYPQDSGTVDETGAGAGLGFNLNVPLPPGSGCEAYLVAMREVVVPALDAYQPELILVSCGFDASAMDPFARMLLHSDCFRDLARDVLDAAERHCGGRIVFCHEGGYSSAYVPFCGLAVLEAITGVQTDVEDPFLAQYRAVAGQTLQPHQRAAIDEAGGALELLRASA